MNNSGQRGSTIPLDEDTEHSNNFIKQGVKNLGPNVTEKAVTTLKDYCNLEDTPLQV